METISGRLEYLGWQRPWWVNDGTSSYDASTVFWDTAEAMAGSLAEHTYHRDGYVLRASETSDTKLEIGKRGEGALISKADGSFGFSNVAAYLEGTLCALNARTVNVSYDPGKLFWIEAAAFEDVPGVKYHNGNMARVPSGMEVEVCGLGNGPEATCIFLTLAGKGFECAKFSGPLGRTILERRATGEMKAQRIGNCRCLGREEAE